MNYYEKYLKYKTKYQQLVHMELIGGNPIFDLYILEYHEEPNGNCDVTLRLNNKAKTKIGRFNVDNYYTFLSLTIDIEPAYQGLGLSYQMMKYMMQNLVQNKYMNDMNYKSIQMCIDTDASWVKDAQTGNFKSFWENIGMTNNPNDYPNSTHPTYGYEKCFTLGKFESYIQSKINKRPQRPPPTQRAPPKKIRKLQLSSGRKTF
jgi:hypothetical protein